MALYKDPRKTLLSVIERENGITLGLDDYDFSDPVPATPPEGSDASFNTRISLIANNVAAPYAGEIDLYYNRLDLNDLGSMVELYIQSPVFDTTHDILDSLNRRFGLNLTEDDIVLKDTVDMGGYRVAELEATETSLGWIGNIDVSVVEGDLLLEDYLLDTALGGLNYPTEYPTKTFAQFYSYWRDFSDHHDYLTTLTTDSPMSLEIASLLGDITGDPWVASGQSEFSIGGNARITYAGSTADYPAANDTYDHVVVIELDLDACTEMTGSLVIHSSEPFDPNDIL